MRPLFENSIFIMQSFCSIGFDIAMIGNNLLLVHLFNMGEHFPDFVADCPLKTIRQNPNGILQVAGRIEEHFRLTILVEIRFIGAYVQSVIFGVQIIEILRKQKLDFIGNILSIDVAHRIAGGVLYGKRVSVVSRSKTVIKTDAIVAVTEADVRGLTCFVILVRNGCGYGIAHADRERARAVDGQQHHSQQNSKQFFHHSIPLYIRCIISSVYIHRVL